MGIELCLCQYPIFLGVLAWSENGIIEQFEIKEEEQWEHVDVGVDF